MPLPSPFSFRLEPELKKRLQEEARRSDRSLGYVTQRAIEGCLDSLEEKRAAIRDALARADEGHVVSGEQVHAWIESWDGAGELAMPGASLKPARRGG